ncbi:MAG: polyphenol oxidase family protein [Candidatus Sungbacteria bacterium]|uniref:Polyphenol oxidase family protein n=1 Tax=Candidatus Sungiibacteriota bacterium TaxID=2750080 RepID=A0A9D6QVG7_9BACT|nr:polyphenol oxidase family protein [Candidatus Sungbacteria bacterium]
MRFYENVSAYLSTVDDGPMGSSTNRVGQYAENRERFLAKNGIAPGQLVLGGLVSKDRIGLVTKVPPTQRVPDTDALVTKIPGIALGMVHSDCFPVYLRWPSGIALVHAGWRGISLGIVSKTLKRLKALGVDPSLLAIQIGVGIQQCHFVMQDDENGVSHFLNDRDPSLDYRRHIKRVGELFYVDLRAVALVQIHATYKAFGLTVLPGQMRASKECSFCGEGSFYSQRRQPTPGHNNLSVMVC